MPVVLCALHEIFLCFIKSNIYLYTSTAQFNLGYSEVFRWYDTVAKNIHEYIFTITLNI